MAQETKGKHGLKERRLLDALRKGMPLENAAKFAGLSLATAEKCALKRRISLPSNDTQIDDMLREAEAIDPLLFSGADENFQVPEVRSAKEKSAIIDELTANCSPANLRDLAQTMLRIADAIDQNWQPENLRSAYHWPSSAARIERNALALAKQAQAILRFRQQRAKAIPADLVGEPAWDMLLELFCQFAGGAAISSKSLSLVSGAPPTTAMRQIDKLENAGLITRKASDQDRRVTLVELTKEGVLAVGRTLEKYS